MGKIYERITEELSEWIKQQRMFFVATAPLSENGHVNCSPKGSDSLRIIDEHTIAYQDLTGSGIETIAHIRENRRIVIMFCAFDGPPKIVRLHGDGEVITPDQSVFQVLEKSFPKNLGTRAFIRINLTRISDSCGYAVPEFTFAKQREALDKWADVKSPEGLMTYRQEKNQMSIDGLPGLPGLG